MAASRTRLVDTAYAERQRIERDLHDSVQQDLVALRIGLQVLGESVNRDPSDDRQAIAALGRDVDRIIDAIRLVARGIYPSILDEHGLELALRSAADRCSRPVAVAAAGLGRLSGKLEVAIYFVCLEAMQNYVKHTGPEARAMIRVWTDADEVRFEVRDSGSGFDPTEIRMGSGLLNMRDRIETVGGVLTVSSVPGQGTAVEGRITRIG